MPISYFKDRWRITLLVITTVIVIHLFTAPKQIGQSLIEGLAKETGLIITPNSLHFVHSTNKPLGNATNAQKILFIAAPKKGGNRDLYAASVRITPDKKLIAASKLVNITESSHADDEDLQFLWPYAAVTARVNKVIRSITVFKLNGPIGPQPVFSTGEKYRQQITNKLRFDERKGIGRLVISFKEPTQKVNLSFFTGANKPMALIRWQTQTKKMQVAEVRLDPPGTENSSITVRPEIQLPKQAILWMVDTVRGLPFIGPGPIEWVEGRVFALKDKWRQWRYAMSADKEDSFYDGPSTKTAQVAIDVEGDDGLGVRTIQWPPKDLDPPVFSRKRIGEGHWTPSQADFVKHLPDAPPSVYDTYVRPDRNRPYARVKLFAFDTRQLNLHVVGGHEDPISTTGEVGTGQLPRDAHTLKNTVLVFNGAFKTIHGEYGMMADHTLLLPPKDGGATIAMSEDGRIGLGNWPEKAPIPPTMHSLRQNMDPLVENGVINPRRRYLWGFTLGKDITMMNTIRSGICLRDDGTLIYAWGDDLTAQTMGVAMNAAGCSYGIHLDMNPFHTALIAFQFKPYEGGLPKFTARKLIRDIRFWADRYVLGAPKDFFYMTLRENVPPGQGWSSEGLSQPAPRFLPTLFRKKIAGATMLAVDLMAVKGSLVPGARPENDNAATPPPSESLLAELLMDPSLLEGRPQGFKLMVHKGEPIRISDAKKTLPAEPDTISGLPFLKGGNLTTSEPDKMMAIGISADGRWLLAGTGNSLALGRAMEQLNVNKAIGFPTPTDQPMLLVRTPKGMITIDGKPVTSRNATLWALRIEATNRAPFGVPLRKLFK